MQNDQPPALRFPISVRRSVNPMRTASAAGENQKTSTSTSTSTRWRQSTPVTLPCLSVRTNPQTPPPWPIPFDVDAKTICFFPPYKRAGISLLPPYICMARRERRPFTYCTLFCIIPPPRMTTETPLPTKSSIPTPQRALTTPPGCRVPVGAPDGWCVCD